MSLLLDAVPPCLVRLPELTALDLNDNSLRWDEDSASGEDGSLDPLRQLTCLR